MKRLSAKQRMLSALSKQTGQNTFTTAQARTRFGVSNVSARINDLRQDGHKIITNVKTTRDGRKVSYYQLSA